MTIERFRGDYFFLSNMYPLKVHIPTSLGLLVPSSEHVYMAERFKNPQTHVRVAGARGNSSDERIYKDGLAAKELAHKLIQEGELQVDDFEISRTGLMLVAVRNKFNFNHDIARLLLATGDEELVEGNDWGDRFWGVDPIGSDNGENNLGKILMQVRDELKELA